MNETLLCVGLGSPLSPSVLSSVVEQCNDWCNDQQIRIKVLSGRYLFISTNPKALLIIKHGIGIGERVRTHIGLAELIGSACNKLWFTFPENGTTWYFSNKQIKLGRDKGYFYRCSYESTKLPTIDDINSTSTSTSTSTSISSKIGMNVDVSFMIEIMDPIRWPDQIDALLVSFLNKLAESKEISVWDVTCESVCVAYRGLQMQLSKLVMGDIELSHRWGISGPKRKAVVARLGKEKKR